MRAPGLIWFPRGLYERCLEDAAHWFPLETGGVLIGYWNAETAVVTGLIEPGPNAKHETHNFEPDQEWQLGEIAKRHRETDGRETYLGDWHTHPNAKSGKLSWTDRQVLRAIMNKPKAQTPRPVMMIIYGADDDWRAEAWEGSRRARRPVWWAPRISAMPLRIWDP